MTEKEGFLEYMETCLTQLSSHRKIAVECYAHKETLELYDKVIDHCNKVKALAKNSELSVNYFKLFQNDLNQTLQFFKFRSHTIPAQFTEQMKTQYRTIIELENGKIEQQLILLQFNFDLFEKFEFFNNNIVAIGANGSGKTSLSNDIRKYLPQKNAVVISAQRILIIPTFSGISNVNTTSQKLAASQVADKTSKITYSTEHIGQIHTALGNVSQEFQFLLGNLLAERNTLRNKFINSLQRGGKDYVPPIAKLDKALSIWNSLIEHRTIECEDGINLSVKGEEGSYPAFQMSDGEKVILYLIAQVLQAPDSGFIIIDEPEMYLHKTILKKLWDIIEKERQDCIFMYLTHDLDFATSRATAKKIWIRSFKYPDKWEVENIAENQLPEPLLLELLGSRKNILFCEGEKGSLDEKIYNILFPHFTIAPVGNSFAVINYVKAFNKLPNSTTKALGIIDSDHHGAERLSALKSDGIFSYSLAEPENLFLDEEFLKMLAKQLLKDEKIVGEIESAVFLQLEKDMEHQIANYVSAKINYYFKESHVTKGNTLNDVNKHYESFTQQVKIKEWYVIRKKELEDIVVNKDYSKALSVINNKGLKQFPNKYFKIADFTERAVKFLQNESPAQVVIKKYFPEELKKESSPIHQ